MEFYIEVIFRASIKYQFADTLSQLSMDETHDKGNDDEIPVLPIRQRPFQQNMQTACTCQN